MSKKEEITLKTEALVRIAFNEEEMKIIRKLAEKEGCTPDELAMRAIVWKLKELGYGKEVKKMGYT